MFLIDILIYVFFAWVMYNFAQKSYSINPDEPRWDLHLTFFVSFFTIISAIRWGVGVDCNTYIANFQTGSVADKDASSQEILWNFVVGFIAKYGLHFTIGMGLVAFAQITFITKALVRYKYILVILPIVLFGGRYFGALMNGMRQLLAACIFLYSVQFIVEKKMVKYLICIAIASMIHHSALMLVILYFIPSGFSIKSSLSKYFLFGYLACLVIGQTPQFSSIASYLETFAIFAGYGDGYTDRIVDNLMMGDTSEAQVLGPINLSFVAVALLNIWFFPKIKEYYEDMIPELNIWFLFSYIYGCGFILFHNAGHMLVRPFQYFLLFEMVMMSLLIFTLKEIYGMMSPHLYKVVVAIVWICTLWGMIKSQGIPDEVSTYKVFFNHM